MSTLVIVSMMGTLKLRPGSTVLMILPRRSTAAFSNCFTMKMEPARIMVMTMTASVLVMGLIMGLPLLGFALSPFLVERLIRRGG